MRIDFSADSSVSNGMGRPFPAWCGAMPQSGGFPVQSVPSTSGCRNILHRTHGRRQSSGLVSTLDIGLPQYSSPHSREAAVFRFSQYPRYRAAAITSPHSREAAVFRFSQYPRYRAAAITSLHSREAAVFRFSQHPRYRAAAITVSVQPECAAKKEQADENRPAKQGCGIKI